MKLPCSAKSVAIAAIVYFIPMALAPAQAQNSKAFDFGERLRFLSSNPSYAAKACKYSQIRSIPVVQDATVDWQGPQGAARSSEQMGDVYQAAVRSSTACFRGNNRGCNNIVQTLRRYARTDGFSYSGNRSKTSEQWDDTRLELNNSMKVLVGGYYFAKRRGQVSAGDADIIEPWIRTKVKFYNSYGRYKQDNTLTNAASTNAITGLLLRDRDLVRKAEKQYKASIKAMRRDGSMPNETRRGSFAIHYTGLEIAHLMVLSEVLAMAGTNVFERSSSGDDGIHKAVRYYLDVLENWDGVFRYASAAAGKNTFEADYKNQELKVPALTFGGLEIYRNRYPNHPNVDRINQLKLDPRTCSVVKSREKLYGLCRSSRSRISLKQVIVANTGERDRGIANIYCMFGKPW